MEGHYKPICQNRIEWNEYLMIIQSLPIALYSLIGNAVIVFMF